MKPFIALLTFLLLTPGALAQGVSPGAESGDSPARKSVQELARPDGESCPKMAPTVEAAGWLINAALHEKLYALRCLWAIKEYDRGAFGDFANAAEWVKSIREIGGKFRRQGHFSFYPKSSGKIIRGTKRKPNPNPIPGLSRECAVRGWAWTIRRISG
jgi:hypothetical protein